MSWMMARRQPCQRALASLTSAVDQYNTRIVKRLGDAINLTNSDGTVVEVTVVKIVDPDGPGRVE
jgi:hypothetical protein